VHSLRLLVTLRTAGTVPEARPALDLAADASGAALPARVRNCVSVSVSVSVSIVSRPGMRGRSRSLDATAFTLALTAVTITVATAAAAATTTTTAAAAAAAVAITVTAAAATTTATTATATAAAAAAGTRIAITVTVTVTTTAAATAAAGTRIAITITVAAAAAAAAAPGQTRLLLRQRLRLHARRQQLGRVLQVRAQLVREPAQADLGEEVDGNARVFRRVRREDAGKGHPHTRVVEAIAQHDEAQRLAQLLHQHLEEYARRRGGVSLGEADARQTRPRQRVRVQQVREEQGHVADFVGLEAVDCRILLPECGVEGLLVHAIHHAEALPHEAVVALVRPLVRAALNEHVAQLPFVAAGDLDLGELVRALFEGRRAHYGQVDGPPQVHQLRLGQVHDGVSG
jgi:hypothetical protein